MAFDRYAFLSEVLVVASDCLDAENPPNGSCSFSTFVGLGKPPQDCSSLSARWLGARLLTTRNKCYPLYEEKFELSYNRCCLSNNGETFDPVKEDEDARCFLDDFGYLFECLSCKIGTVAGLQSLNVASCEEPFVKIAVTDVTTRGGCYEAAIEFGFSRLISCCEYP